MTRERAIEIIHATCLCMKRNDNGKCYMMNCCECELDNMQGSNDEYYNALRMALVALRKMERGVNDDR